MTRNQKPTPALAMSRRQALRRTLMGVSLGWLMPWRVGAGMAHAATTVTLLPSTAITYAVSGKKSGIRYTATATLRWQRNATRYIAALSASLLVFLKREQTSSGQVVAGLPAPRRFVDKGKRIRQADLDPVTQRIRYTEAGGAPWTADTQDRVSLFFALPAAVKRAQAAGLKQFGFPVTSANALAEWTVAIEPRETITTPLGTWAALRLRRIVDTTRDTQATIWLAGSHDLLPVRILLEEPDGTFLDQRISQQTPLPDLT